MSLIRWDDNYKTGIEVVDEQHRNLIEMINDLHKAMREARGREVMGDILDRLLKYTVYHFGTEEKLMKEYSYPKYLSHFTKHQKLTDEVKNFQARFNAGERMITIKFMEFLSSWLNDHILQTDKKFGAFVTSK